MKNLSSLKDSILSPIFQILKHHAIIAILIVLGVMIFTVYSVGQFIALPSDEQYRAEQLATKAKTKFDEETILKVERLNARQENASLSLPSGRINPFTE